jgi:purine-binding chemotaxis protein CheW
VDSTFQPTAVPIDAPAPAGDELLTFRLAGRRLGIAVRSVDRVVRAAAVTTLPQAPAVVLGVVDVAGEAVPVMDVRGRFGLERKDLSPHDFFLFAVSRGRRVALVVDAVDDLVRIDATQDLAVEVPHVSGVATGPDGLLLVHDVDAFLSFEEERQLDAALREVRE